MSDADEPHHALRAVCIDLDGTLVDSGPLHIEAERLALASLGVPELADDHPETFGAGIMPGMQILADHYGLGSAERVLDAYLPAWESAFETGLKPLPGADEFLTRSSKRGLPVVLVTSGESDYVQTVLRRFDWPDAFSHLVTLESVTRIKPDPEPYLTAARLLGLEPSECGGIEDSASGLAAVLAAGMFSIAVGDGATGKLEHEPDLRFDSLEQFDDRLLDSLFGPDS